MGLTELSLEELAADSAQPGSQRIQAVNLEFARRQTIAQQEAAASQERAARATDQTATYTRHNARYMLWSVFVLTLSSIATFVMTLLTYLTASSAQ